jgi:hypothetical protein
MYKFRTSVWTQNMPDIYRSIVMDESVNHLGHLNKKCVMRLTCNNCERTNACRILVQDILQITASKDQDEIGKIIQTWIVILSCPLSEGFQHSKSPIG